MKNFLIISLLAFAGCNGGSSDSTCNQDSCSTTIDTVRYPKDSVVEIDSLPVDTIKTGK